MTRSRLDLHEIGAREAHVLARAIALASTAQLVALATGCAREANPASQSATAALPSSAAPDGSSQASAPSAMTTEAVPTVTIPTAAPPTAAPSAQAAPSASPSASTEPAQADGRGVARGVKNPGWIANGAYCIAASKTTPPRNEYGCGHGSTALHEIEPGPTGMHGFTYSHVATEIERQKTPGACCYEVIRPARGRPLCASEEGRAPLVAPSIVRDGWADASGFDASRYDAATRARAAEAWASNAALEHASIAEFSRVALGLLAHGAPSELVVGAHQAALDEVRHARLGYAIASAFADGGRSGGAGPGSALGPGRLAVERAAAPSLDLVAFAMETLDDGCLGESLSALELAVAAATSEDEGLAALLRTIADDEGRHAALAWSILGWAVSVATAEQRGAIAARIDERLAAARAEVAPSSLEDTRLADRTSAEAPVPGVLGAYEAAAVRRQGLLTVVIPGLARVLDALGVASA